MKSLVFASIILSSLGHSLISRADDSNSFEPVKDPARILSIENVSSACNAKPGRPELSGIQFKDGSYAFHLSEFKQDLSEKPCPTAIKFKVGKGYKVRMQRVSLAGSYERKGGKTSEIRVTNDFDANSIPEVVLNVPADVEYFQKTLVDLPATFSSCSDGKKDLTLKVDAQIQGEVPAKMGTMLYVLDVLSCKS